MIVYGILRPIIVVLTGIVNTSKCHCNPLVHGITFGTNETCTRNYSKMYDSKNERPRGINEGLRSHHACKRIKRLSASTAIPTAGVGNSHI